MILSTHGIVGSISGAIPLFLDLYPNAAAAYSVRKLRTLYTGSAIQVRRSSDNTTQDIGFTALGNLDTSALTSFCGSGNGFVTTWYDQSGNANNATQSTASEQPQIVSSGSVIVVNSIPSIDVTGGQTLNYSLTATNTVLGVYKLNSIQTVNYLIWRKSPNNGHFLATSFLNGPGIFDGASLYDSNFGNNTNHHLINFNYNGSINQVAVDAAGFFNLSSSTALLSSDTIGRPSIGFSVGGKMQELIMYTSSQSSNKTGISSNINTYYAIY
jgi:hypothetical protein